MSLPNYLAKIKSSGIYRFVWDKSEITATDAETLRLMVGYSDKGPFNTPVYIDNTADFVNIFGNINKKLEKRGIFFHRMCLQALQAGPILALNVKKFDGTELLDYVTIGATKKVTGLTLHKGTDDGTGDNAKVGAGSTTLPKVYNTDRFWSLDADQLVELPNTSAGAASEQYITIAATDSKETSASIFMRACRPSGYDVTIKNWYTTIGEDMPDYFIGYEDMKVADFFAEIYVFKGQFTAGVASSEELKAYFKTGANGSVTLKNDLKDAFGNDLDTLDALAANENSGFIQRYQGVILPYFKNTSGSYISLDIIFNQDQDIHKLLMKIDGDKLENNYYNPGSISVCGTYGIDSKTIEKIVAKGGETEMTILSNKNINITSNVYTAKTAHEIAVGSSVTDQTLHDNPNFMVFALGGVNSALSDGGTYPQNIKDGVVYLNPDYIKAGGISAGDRFLVSKTQNGSNPIVVTAKSVSIVGKTSEAPDASWVNISNIEDAKALGAIRVEFDTTKDCYPFTGFVNESAGSNTTAEGAGVWSHSQSSHTDTKTDDGDVYENRYIIKCNAPIEGIHTMSPTYIQGYTLNNDPDSTKYNGNIIKRNKLIQKHILSALSATEGYKGLVEALTNRTDIDYRYIVDTFESYPDQELKSIFALIAKQKDNCLALLNFPSIKSFTKYPGHAFTDTKGAFDIKYIKNGKNSTSTEDIMFSLPSIDNGASWCSFNTPVVFTDGLIKTVCPSAALVSNRFMDKYNSRQPYYIVAGPVHGRLTYPGLIGPDHNYTRAELDVLEPMGVNATVYVPRKGTYINSNQTAKQTPVTALSKINVRELVIYLQDQIQDMLENYHWEFNTPTLRDIIKAKADTICENVRANGGIHKFLNICDETNNTDDVINNEMIVLSTMIEPGMGAGKMVQELTIYRRGGMTATIS